MSSSVLYMRVHSIDTHIHTHKHVNIVFIIYKIIYDEQ